MDVGSSHRYAQGSAYCVDQDAILVPTFAASVGFESANRLLEPRTIG